MAKLKGKILIVDDDDYILLSLRMFLEQHFEWISTLNDPDRLVDLMDEEDFDLVILDMNFKEGETSGADGLNWMEKILSADPESNLIMMTAYGGVNLAVEAIKMGAKDFIVKPWENERLLATVISTFNLSQEKKNVRQLKGRQKILSSSVDNEFSIMIGSSKPMEIVQNAIDKVASTDADVLILGENGTGKELVARAIHRASKRSNEVFISIDLGAISETLFESELFGHKKGAFTDAKDDRIGRFEAASKGTLFLDEIGNLSLPLQAKLLSVLHKRQVIRVGTNEPIDVDVRLICATNMPLSNMVTDGDFREDLLFRINTVEIQVPPLRVRIEDVPLIATHYLDIYRKKYKKQKLELSDAAVKQIQNYSWPGNVRELQHALERAVIMVDEDVLDKDDFNFIHKSGNDQSPDDLNLESLEEWAVKKAIAKHRGNISHAAKELGLSRGAMYRRLEKYGL